MWIRVEPDDLFHRAQMTAIQFAALRARMSPAKVIAEMKHLDYLRGFQASTTVDKSDVSKYLKNGWNTEYLLRLNAESLAGDALRNSLHWAFPQAYYAVFAVALAFFKVAGFTEMAHASVIRKIGVLMRQNKYRTSIGFLADGGKERAFHNIERTELPSTSYFDDCNKTVCDSQICQFLNATREIDLREKSQDLTFRTKAGTRKKALNRTEWDKVSVKLGLTSILSLLYRKRIKSNYRDIETYLSQHLDPAALYNDVITVVASLNFVHEFFILRGMGASYCDGCVNDVRRHGYTFLTRRAGRVAAIAS